MHSIYSERSDLNEAAHGGGVSVFADKNIKSQRGKYLVFGFQFNNP